MPLGGFECDKGYTLCAIILIFCPAKTLVEFPFIGPMSA